MLSLFRSANSKVWGRATGRQKMGAGSRREVYIPRGRHLWGLYVLVETLVE